MHASLLVEPDALTFKDDTSSSSGRIIFEGSNPGAFVRGVGQRLSTSNYYVGSDSSQWRPGIPHYEGAVVVQLYEGIDLHISRHGDLSLGYEFVLAPGADPNRIVSRFSCVGSAACRAEAAAGTIVDPGQRTVGASEARTALSRLDQIRASTITKPTQHFLGPSIAFSTYFGGSGSDGFDGVAVDVTGGAVICGQTTSLDLPLQAPAQGSYGGGSADIHVAKFSPDGSLVYSTYLGGSSMGAEGPRGIAADGLGNVVVTGITTSADFPLLNAFQTTFGGRYDAFVAKLDDTGQLVYSTFLGGDLNDDASAVAADRLGNAVICGSTFSYLSFPIKNAFQPLAADASRGEAFVTKLGPDGALVYSSYLGGSATDACYGAAIAANGTVAVVGRTGSLDFPLVGAVQSTLASATETDAFVTEVNPDGLSLVFSTFLGGVDRDGAIGVTYSSGGELWVTGSTASTDFPMRNPLQGVLSGGGDGFITAYDAARTRLDYSTYLGGDGSDLPSGIKVGTSGSVHLAGRTTSTNFPLSQPLQATLKGIQDGFYSVFSPGGGGLDLSTYVGGSDRDSGNMDIDACENAFVGGYTNSTDIATINAFQPAFGGADDAFLVRLDKVSSTLSTVGNSLLAAWAVRATQIGFRWTDVAAASGYNLREKSLKSSVFSALTTSALSGNPGATVTSPGAALVFYNVLASHCGSEGPI